MFDLRNKMMQDSRNTRAANRPEKGTTSDGENPGKVHGAGCKPLRSDPADRHAGTTDPGGQLSLQRQKRRRRALCGNAFCLQ
jgi:hypothetical protein